MYLLRALWAVGVLASGTTAFLAPNPSTATTGNTINKPASTSSTSSSRNTMPPARIAHSSSRVSSSFMEGENIPPHVKAELEAQAQEARAKIETLVKNNQVMLFMKGSKMFPMCGFSNTAVQVLRASEAEFETFDVLSDPAVRDEIKKYSSFPTIPQCYIQGEFVGGSDILLELFESGELQTMLQKQ